MKAKYLFLTFVFIFFKTYSQTDEEARKCGSLKQNKPLLFSTNSKKLRTEASTGVFKIPIVVHVIHNVADGTIGQGSNISYEQIISQIEVLNEDFRRKTGTNGFNSNAVGADVEIEFHLATIDTNCTPFSGITRHYYNKNSYNAISDDILIKSFSYYPTEEYLNIWICSLSGGTLGIATFPEQSFLEGINEAQPDDTKDGIIINHKAFGRQIGSASSGNYNLGRTTTHEIGHWLGLLHIWGDDLCGDDYCNDTPTVQGSNGSSCDLKISTCNNRPAMIENYMDYSSDRCMNIFTLEQKNRMRTALNNSPARIALANSKAQNKYIVYELPYIEDFNSSTTLTSINWSQTTTSAGYNWNINNGLITLNNALSTTGFVNSLTTPFLKLPFYNQSNYVLTVNFTTKYPNLLQTDSLVLSQYMGCNKPKKYIQSIFGSDLSSSDTFKSHSITISGLHNLEYIKFQIEVFSKGKSPIELDNFSVQTPVNNLRNIVKLNNDNNGLKLSYLNKSNEILAFLNENNNENITFEIIDILGKLVQKNEFEINLENKYTIRLNQNLRGLFLVKSYSRSTIFYSKILILNE
ncbi:MAG: hypothetical protein EAZ27_09020 [Cytophagales bacterium]|nr:MAG: hypothetical protein EAZ27_09020 [Cytophagales bacterium]